MMAVHKVQSQHISVKSEESQNISMNSDEDGNLSIEKSKLENDHRMEIKVDGYKVWNTNPVNSKLENTASNSWDTTSDNFTANDTFERKNDDSVNGLKHEWKNNEITGDSSNNPIKKEDIDAEISDDAFANDAHCESKVSKKCCT